MGKVGTTNNVCLQIQFPSSPENSITGWGVGEDCKQSYGVHYGGRGGGGGSRGSAWFDWQPLIFSPRALTPTIGYGGGSAHTRTSVVRERLNRCVLRLSLVSQHEKRKRGESSRGRESTAVEATELRTVASTHVATHGPYADISTQALCASNNTKRLPTGIIRRICGIYISYMFSDMLRKQHDSSEQRETGLVLSRNF